MNELDTVKIGNRIRKNRESMLLTQEKLAEMLGVSVKFIGDIESGAKGMSLKTLNKLSNCLLVSTDYILYGEDKHEEFGEILRLLKKCPDNKLPYAIDILKVYIRSFIEK